MRKLKSKQGFTLIEVVVVMAIIAVLATLVIGAIMVARNTQKETVHRSNARAIQTGLEAYYAKQRSYPTTAGSFKDIATTLGVTLAGSDTDECGSGGVARGGTYSYNTSTNQYTITPYNAACAGTGGGALPNDVITGP